MIRCKNVICTKKRFLKFEQCFGIVLREYFSTNNKYSILYTLSIKLLVNPSWVTKEERENETSSLSSSVNLLLECELVPSKIVWKCYPKAILTAWKNKKEINKNRVYDNNLKLRIVFQIDMSLEPKCRHTSNVDSNFFSATNECIYVKCWKNECL